MRPVLMAAVAVESSSAKADDEFEKTAAITLDGDAALPPATFSQTMRYADKWDWIGTILGACVRRGRTWPFSTLRRTPPSPARRS